MHREVRHVVLAVVSAARANAVRAVTVVARDSARRVLTDIPAMRRAFRRTMPIPAASIPTAIGRVIRVPLAPVRAQQAGRVAGLVAVRVRAARAVADPAGVAAVRRAAIADRKGRHRRPFFVCRRVRGTVRASMQIARAPAVFARDADVDAIDVRACRWPIEHRAHVASVRGNERAVSFNHA